MITITLGFSKAVNVTGTPTLALNTTGGPAGSASYTSGTGTNTLSFTYTVAAGQSANPLDAASTAALVGTITDTVPNEPNAAVLTVVTGSANAGALANAKNIVINTVPAVATVTSTAVSWGASGNSGPLLTQSDGLRLLPAGRHDRHALAGHQQADDHAQRAGPRSRQEP